MENDENPPLEEEKGHTEATDCTDNDGSAMYRVKGTRKARKARKLYFLMLILSVFSVRSV